jgi:hypothetical protein
VIYVEWLRVRNALKVVAIVFAVLLVGCGGLRLYLSSQGDIIAYADEVAKQPGTSVTHSVLPDGAKRTVIDSPADRLHMTIDDRGYEGTHIEILDRSHSGRAEKTISIGSVQVEALPDRKGERVLVDTGRPVPYVFFAAIAALVAMIVATVLAAPFARENDGHLEIALTKPISRVTLAFATIGVDFAGILAAWLLTMLCLIAGEAIFQAPGLSFGSYDLAATVLGLLGAFAWYAMLCAVTTSMKRGYGAMLGIAWPVCIGLLGWSRANVGTIPALQALRAAGRVLNYLNPLEYIHFGPAYTVNGQPHGSLAFSTGVEGPALAALLVAYVALAVYQWQRVEA